MSKNKEKNDIVIIELDRPRKLRYGHKALKTLSAITGKNLDELEVDNFQIDDIEKYIYCGLLTDARESNETLKLEDMEDLLDQAPSYGELMQKMTEAFNAAFGSFGEDDVKNAQGIAEQKTQTK